MTLRESVKREVLENRNRPAGEAGSEGSRMAILSLLSSGSFLSKSHIQTNDLSAAVANARRHRKWSQRRSR
jgi:hypothetical protein